MNQIEGYIIRVKSIKFIKTTLTPLRHKVNEYNNKLSHNQTYKTCLRYIKKYQISLIFTSILLLLIGSLQFYISPKIKNNNYLLIKKTTLTKQAEQLKNKQSIKEKTDLLKSHLFTNTGLLKFSSQWIPLTAKKHHIQINNSSYSEPKIQKQTIQQTINLNISTSFASFVTFIKDIETCGKYIEIHALSLKHAPSKSNAPLHASLTLNGHGIHEE